MMTNTHGALALTGYHWIPPPTGLDSNLDITVQVLYPITALPLIVWWILKGASHCW